MAVRANDGTKGTSSEARAARLRNPETAPNVLPSPKDLEAVSAALEDGHAAVVVGSVDGRVLGRVLTPVARFSKDGRKLSEELAVMSPTTGESQWRDAEGQPVTAGAVVAVPNAKGGKRATHPAHVALVFPDGNFTTLKMEGAGMRTYSTGVVDVDMNGVTYSAEVRVKVRKDSWAFAVARIFSGGRVETSGTELIEESTLLVRLQ